MDCKGNNNKYIYIGIHMIYIYYSIIYILFYRIYIYIYNIHTYNIHIHTYASHSGAIFTNNVREQNATGGFAQKKSWLDNPLNFPCLPCWIPMVDLKCFQGCMT